MKVDAYDGWTTQGHAWWEVGTPHISNSATVTDKHQETEAARSAQRAGI
jgi:3D-(3,5/4)-trihydroxycyclohexane-1,2-dione acylhydrolase (decyclizing)